MFVQGIRGATTIERDCPEEIKLKTRELLAEIMDKNSLKNEDIVYVLFTATDDIKSIYPAVAAREMGLDDIPLLCCQEMEVANSLTLCIRVLMLVQRAEKTEAFHAYRERAVSLRPDIMIKQQGSSSINE